jgi:hypothetical protein
MRLLVVTTLILGLVSFLFIWQKTGTDPSSVKNSVTESSRLMELSEWVSKGAQPDRRLNKRVMSVRWTGQLRAPATGEYVFRQVPSPRGNSQMKLWIDKQLVLGTGTSGASSTPIALTANKPVVFHVELSHKGNTGFPVAILTWESESLERQIIPSSAFFVSKDKAGLNGEYFADESFNRKAFDRIDESIDFIWDFGSVEHCFAPNSRETSKSILSKVTNDSFLASLSEEEAHEFSEQIVMKLLAGMTASERLAIIETLSRHDRLLRGLPIDRFLAQLTLIGILDGDKIAELLFAWAKKNPLPRTVPGSFISGTGTYHTLNVAPYRRIGQSLRDSIGENLDSIFSILELPGGVCNLTILYALVSSGRDNRRLPRINRMIDEKLTDDKLSNDARVTWLLAKAYFQEIGTSEMIRPGRALPVLNEALAIAETSKYRFLALQEIVARLITVNQMDEAKNLIDSMREQFQIPEQQTTINRWLNEAALLAMQYDESKNTINHALQSELNNEMDRRNNTPPKVGGAEAAHMLGTRYAAPTNRN